MADNPGITATEAQEIETLVTPLLNRLKAGFKS